MHLHHCIQKQQNHAQQPKQLLSQLSGIHRLMSHHLCYHTYLLVANDSLSEHLTSVPTYFTITMGCNARVHNNDNNYHHQTNYHTTKTYTLYCMW